MNEFKGIAQSLFSRYSFEGALPVVRMQTISPDIKVVFHERRCISFAYKPAQDCEFHFSLLSEVGKPWISCYEKWLEDFDQEVVEIDCSPWLIHRLNRLQ